MRGRFGAACLLVALLAAGHAWAGGFATPDAAVNAFHDAYRRKNIDDIVAVRAFEFEAREALLRKLGGAAQPDDIAIRSLARQKETEFRQHVRAKGLAPIDYSECTVEDSRSVRADLVKFPQQCAGPDKTTIFLSIHAVKGDTGWRVVLGPVAQ